VWKTSPAQNLSRFQKFKFLLLFYEMQSAYFFKPFI
jgi:hypothetical protein